MPNGYGSTDQTYVPPGWRPVTRCNGRVLRLRPGPAVGLLRLQAGRERDASSSTRPDEYQTDVYADKAVEAIDDHADAPSRTTPSTCRSSSSRRTTRPTPRPAHVGAFATAPLPMDKSFNEKDVERQAGLAPRRQADRRRADLEDQTRYRNRLETPARGRRGGQLDRQHPRRPRGCWTTPTSSSPRTTASCRASTACTRASSSPTSPRPRCR